MSNLSQPHSRAPQAAARVSTATASVSQILIARGAIAGCFGAGTLAIWFLAIDVITREPLWSPSLVGAAFLNGTSPSATVGVDLGLTAAFSVVHCLVFGLFGVASAIALHRAGVRAWSPAGVTVLAAGLLSGFVIGDALVAPGVGAALGWIYVVGGNAAAAVSMALCFAALPAVDDVRPD